ncbi:MAG: tetratricopeptide repeat protein [Bdellovibrionaceae bacterium]|nr:tetratricopeptide repeat protein [Pseudobdellovibrionaceae bacterium]
MMNQFFSILTLLLGLLVLPSCLLTRHDIKANEEKKQLSNQVSTLQQTNAESQNQMIVLDQSYNELRGRIEVLEKIKMDQEQSLANKDLEKENQFQVYEQALEKNEKRIQGLETEIADLKKQLAKKKVAKKKVKKPKGNYTSAESYFSKKDWKKAIVGYQKYRELNPKGRRYPEVTYKIGVCFQELGMADNAKIFYQEVVEKFSKSKEAKKSKYRLKKL